MCGVVYFPRVVFDNSKEIKEMYSTMLYIYAPRKRLNELKLTKGLNLAMRRPHVPFRREVSVEKSRRHRIPRVKEQGCGKEVVPRIIDHASEKIQQ